MATQIVPAPKSVEHTGTAPLSQSAREAMRRLESALITPDPVVVAKVNAVLGFRASSKPRAYLGETATYLMAGYRATLAAAGRLDLIGVAS